MNFKILIIMAFNFFSPILSTTSCYYSQFKDQAQNAIINDYVKNTGWISRTFVLSNIKKWENNNLIKDISSINIGDVQLSDILQWYFGDQVINKNIWNVKSDYFIANRELLQKVIPPENVYIVPYEKEKKIKNQLISFKRILNVLPALDVELINASFGDDGIIEQEINQLITGEQFETLWNNDLKVIFPEILKLCDKIKKYNDFINNSTYNEVLEIASKNIKNMVINIFDSEATYEKILEDNIKISLGESKNIKLDAKDFLDKIKNFFKNPKNFLIYIPDFLAIISYLVESYNKVPNFNVTKVWRDNIGDGIPEIFEKIGKDKYQGLNQIHIKNLKPLLKNVFNSLENDGLSLRKILLSIQQNKWLKELVQPIKIQNATLLGSIIDILAKNSALNQPNIFNNFYNDNKSKIVEFLNTPMKYLDFISSSINGESSFDFNNLLINISNLFKKIINEVNDGVIEKIVKSLNSGDKKQVLKEIKQVLGISKDENLKLVINKDSILDILLKINQTNYFKNFINLISGDQEFIDKFIISKDEEINENYLNFFQDNKYWNTSNINYKYLENNGIEISYNLKYLEDSQFSYFFKWKSEFNKNSFKLVDFETI